MTRDDSRGSDDRCPGCGGPITFSPDNSGGVTVNFHCANLTCEYGKHPPNTQPEAT